MATHQITCITRDRSDPDRRIDSFGGPTFGRLNIDGLIAAIRSGDQFWVGGNPSAWIEILQHPTSRRYYVRTVPDGIHDNNLYSLPECPR